MHLKQFILEQFNLYEMVCYYNFGTIKKYKNRYLLLKLGEINLMQKTIDLKLTSHQ